MIDNLFPYQLEGASWLTQNRFRLLADEMGLGKSAQTVVAADQLSLVKILVICPAVARINWEREFTQWTTKSREYKILQKMKDTPLENGVNICSFEFATANAPKLKGPWDVVVIDETHYLKSVEAKRAKAILGRDGIVRGSARIWALSGTPAPNHAGELWVLLYTFGATPLSHSAFVERYCDVMNTSFGQSITGTKMSRIPELKQILSQCMLRRKKMDVLKQLPHITYSDLVVEPGVVDIDGGEPQSFIQYIFPNNRMEELETKLANERKILEGMLGLESYNRDKMKMLEGMATSVSTLRRYSGIQKVEAVAKLVKEEIEAGLYTKLVIFAVHRDVIEMLRTRLNKLGVVTVYGGTDPDKRQRHIDKFQKNPRKPRIFIGNIAAAGTNITLTSAHNMIFIEQDWVPGNNAQAAMRCHRIGQKKNVHVRFVSLNNPVDMRIAAVLKRKTRELTEIFD